MSRKKRNIRPVHVKIVGHKTPDHASVGDDSDRLRAGLCDFVHDRNGTTDHIRRTLSARIWKILFHGRSRGEKVRVALHDHIVRKSLKITERDLAESFPDDPRCTDLLIDDISSLAGTDQVTGPDGVDGFLFQSLAEELGLPPSCIGKRHIYVAKRAVLPAVTDQIDSHSFSCLVLKAVDRCRDPSGPVHKFLTAE